MADNYGNKEVESNAKARQETCDTLNSLGTIKGLDSLRHPSMTEDLRGRLESVELTTTRKWDEADKLRELLHLLDNNPGVARIIELMKDLGRL